MFNKCNKLENLNINNFDTKNVTEMGWMFSECFKLKEIKGINKFITNEVTTMNSMFNHCYELENLDLSKFNSSNVKNMSYMFYECNKLKYLNLKNFEINCDTRDMLTFENKEECIFITNNKKLLQLYKST